MFFQDRPIKIREVDDLGELADNLTQNTWTLCTGFAAGPILVINDSTSENGAAEFAIVEPDPNDPTKGVQTDSITFGWMEKMPERALDMLIRAVTEPAGDSPKIDALGDTDVMVILGAKTGGITVPINPHPEHTCELCA